MRQHWRYSARGGEERSRGDRALHRLAPGTWRSCAGTYHRSRTCPRCFLALHMKERWIFGFRRTRSRELSDDERSELNRLSQRYGRKRVILAIASVFLGAVGILGLV